MFDLKALPDLSITRHDLLTVFTTTTQRAQPCTWCHHLYAVPGYFYHIHCKYISGVSFQELSLVCLLYYTVKSFHVIVFVVQTFDLETRGDLKK